MKKMIHTLMSLTLVLSFCLVYTAQAQVVATADIPREEHGDTATPEHVADNNPIAMLSSLSTVSEAWLENVDKQFAEALASSIDAVLEQTLQDIIYLAQFHSDKVTFTKVVSPLLNVYIFDTNKNHRMMALSALHTIGDKYGMQRLRELVNDESSEQVRRLTHRALADYYGSTKN